MPSFRNNMLVLLASLPVGIGILSFSTTPLWDPVLSSAHSDGDFIHLGMAVSEADSMADAVSAADVVSAVGASAAEVVSMAAAAGGTGSDSCIR